MLLLQPSVLLFLFSRARRHPPPATCYLVSLVEHLGDLLPEYREYLTLDKYKEGIKRLFPKQESAAASVLAKHLNALERF